MYKKCLVLSVEIQDRKQANPFLATPTSYNVIGRLPPTTRDIHTQIFPRLEKIHLVFGFGLWLDLDLDLRFDKLIHEQTPIFDKMAGEKKGIPPPQNY